jgi:uncharacterized protein
LLQPQEVEVFYILPAIRREFSLVLKQAGKSQKEIAGLLGVTEAAVSQYFHEKRAKTVFPEKLKEVAKAAALRITDQESMIKETQHVLAYAKESKMICKLHAQVADIPHTCDVCFTR